MLAQTEPLCKLATPTRRGLRYASVDGVVHVPYGCPSCNPVIYLTIVLLVTLARPPRMNTRRSYVLDRGPGSLGVPPVFNPCAYRS